jgi:hypothetical protein
MNNLRKLLSESSVGPGGPAPPICQLGLGAGSSRFPPQLDLPVNPRQSLQILRLPSLLEYPDELFAAADLTAADAIR